MFHGYTWHMSLGWKLESPASWNIAWCDESKALVTVEDAAGNKAGASDVSWFFDEDGETNREGFLGMYAHNWAPAVGSQWVSVKGEVPVAVSRQDVTTEPVTVKLVKGVTVPVVLKGAGLTGKDGKPVDVKATLKVKDYEDDQDDEEKGKKLLNLELVTKQPLAFREFELQTVKDQPMISEYWGGGGDRGEKGYCWSNTLKIESLPEGELKVMVLYAKEPRLVKAVLDSRAALSGFGGGVGGKKAQPVENRKAGVGVNSAAVAAQPGAGKESIIKAALNEFAVKSDTMWMNGKKQDCPLQMFFDVRLEAKGAIRFGGRSDLMEQSLEMTDSTGKVLKPVVFDLSGLSQRKDRGVSYTVAEGKSMELASPGAEWVRVKGTLRVPMAGVKKSPVYEMPLEQRAEQHVPVPGMEEAGDDAGDVATAGDAPTCRVWLEKVDRKKNRQVEIMICLQVEDVPFDFDDFELVDDKGKSLEPHSSGGFGSTSDELSKWHRWLTIEKAADMKKLRFKLKYKTESNMVPVPVDVTVGLGGPVSRKADGAGKGGNAGNAGKGKH